MDYVARFTPDAKPFDNPGLLLALAMPSLLLALPLLVIALLLGQPAWRAWRQRQLATQPFPAFWRRVLQRRMPLFRRLPPDLQQHLRQRMQAFLAEKAFIGCRGLEVTEEMRVLIAAQACLLVLQRPLSELDRVRQILVYPGAFVVRRRHTDAAGVVSEANEALSGESWHEGQVILSWDDTLASAAEPHDGYNVVVHEFAHQLDDALGLSTDLEAEAPSGDWARTVGAAWRELVEAVDRGEAPFLDPYGATAPEEFVAVVSEAFFEQGPELAQAHPALYEAFSRLYRLSPHVW